MENIRTAIEEKIKELEWKNQLRSLEVIDWLKGLLAILPEEKKVEVIEKKIEVEIPEVKPVAKKKIVFNKKK